MPQGMADNRERCAKISTGYDILKVVFHGPVSQSIVLL